jgi:dephospho-CoA kinase
MAARKSMRVALTGGIASGKSAVAALFAQLGAPVVDLDRIAREVVAPGSALLAAVFARFGASVRSNDGSLDRRALRELVFRDPAARRELEALLHPAIQARAAQWMASVEAPYLIVVIPLLAESGTSADYDRVLVVDCDESVQRERLASRDGVEAGQIDAALAAQAPRAERLALATEVIYNAGTLAELGPRVQALHARYLRLARGRFRRPPRSSTISR